MDSGQRRSWCRALTIGGLVALLLCCGWGESASANLLSNGGFEDGDTGGINGSGVPTDWFAWGSESGWHHDDAGKVIDTKAIKFWWDDTGVWQDFTVTAGEEYDFSVMALSVSGDPLIGWNGLLKAEFYNSAVGTEPGDVLASVEVDRYYSASDPLDEWVDVGGVVEAPAGADIGRIILKLADWQSTVGGSLNLDEAGVVLVPEPGTVCLLAFGLVVGLRRRRA
ncbi:MAG: PEP-CTERM sorting domain-containing protein [bacterium]|nr:PEP-CTERM sorting domain-containing protein [bacterium]